jgi:hypothetical protein
VKHAKTAHFIEKKRVLTQVFQVSSFHPDDSRLNQPPNKAQLATRNLRCVSVFQGCFLPSANATLYSILLFLFLILYI